MQITRLRLVAAFSSLAALAAVALSPAANAQAPSGAGAPAAGGQMGGPGGAPAQQDITKSPLFKGITLTPDQKTKITAIQQKYQTEGREMTGKLQSKYMGQLQSIGSGSGTEAQKRAKAKPIVRQMLGETQKFAVGLLNRMTGEITPTLTAAQRPTFAKNKAAMMKQLDTQIKAASAQLQ